METNYLIMPIGDLFSSKYTHSFTYNVNTAHWLDRIKQRSVATGRCTDRLLGGILFIRYRYIRFSTKDSKAVIWQIKLNRLPMDHFPICGWYGMAKKIKKLIHSRMPNHSHAQQWFVYSGSITSQQAKNESQAYYVVSSHNCHRASTHRQLTCVFNSFSVYR